MKYRFLVLLLLTMVCACRGSLERRELSEKQKIANEVRRRSACRIREETGLRPAGTIGQMLRDIQRLGLVFFYNQPVDIVEGRKLLVAAVNIMLEEINQEEKIQPFLCRRPFLPRNIEIQIFLRTPSNGSVPLGELNVLEAVKGSLTFDIHHPTHSGFVTVYKETFDEALARVADPSLPLVAFEPEPLDAPLPELPPNAGRLNMRDDHGRSWYLENGTWVLDPQNEPSANE